MNKLIKIVVDKADQIPVGHHSQLIAGGENCPHSDQNTESKGHH